MSASVAKEEHWALPAEFIALLTRPLEVVLDELVPLPVIRTSKKAQKDAEKQKKEKKKANAFLKAIDSMPSVSGNKTWNGALGHASTGEALLDLFNDLTPGIKGENLFTLLEAAWDVDPEITLRIVFHARSIHEGKGFKQGFLRCVAWLYEKHPRTLLANLHLIVDPTCERARSKKRDEAKAAKNLAENDGVAVLDDEGKIEKDEEPQYPPRPHGSFDDLNQILMLAVNGQLTTKYTKAFTALNGALSDPSSASRFKEARLASKDKNMAKDYVGGLRHESFKREAAASRKGYNPYPDKPPAAPPSPQKAARPTGKKPYDGRPTSAKEDKKEEPSERDVTYLLTKCGTKEMRVAVLQERLAKAMADPKFRALYVAVIDLFAAHLSADLARLDEHMKYLLLPAEKRAEDGYGNPGSSPHLFGMSYAGKWAPTPRKSADKQIHLASALALRLFATRGVDTKTARARYQSEVLTPLRRVLAVPEVKMVQGKWSIEYNKVPSRAMDRYKEAFAAHDPKGFEKYLMDVASGKGTISGASMLPHNLLHEALFGGVIGTRVADLQWATLVDSIRSSSDKELANCIAVADVSGSMGHISYKLPSTNAQPSAIWPCISLTLLLSELARPPWNGSFITFSDHPKVEHIDSSLSLSERASKLSNADWGYNTDYNKVFNEILVAAKRNKLQPEEMVKRVFVFSDMQFDTSGGTGFGRTEHEEVVRMFTEAGYDMPELVYWNLEASASKPVAADTPGTSLVSGFSGALMKYFIRTLGEEPEEESEEGVDEDDEWDEVKTELDEIETGSVATSEKKGKERKEKKEKTPLQHMMAIVGAKPFEGVVIVD